MRKRILDFLKAHTGILQIFYLMGHWLFKIWGVFLPMNKKRIIFASYGGRKFDDSPKALYDAICRDQYFDDWEFVWAFTDTSQHELSRGTKVQIDTPAFFSYLLTSRVWVSNSGMDRNLGICKKQTVSIETWHGTPLKKIGKDQTIGNSVEVRWNYDKGSKIRCAQSEYDLGIFQRIMDAPRKDFLLCDLPRNDELVNHTEEVVKKIKRRLNIPKGKKVLLYMPTYREYLTAKDHSCYIAPPMTLLKWKERLESEYVLLFRAHYAVTSIMGIKEDAFLRNVSDYPSINDLYMVSDILLSDYSSAYVDFSILERPMLCFAYDLEEYQAKRGLYIDLESELPCPIDRDEDTVLDRLSDLDYKAYSQKAKDFHHKYAPYAGYASEAVIKALKERLN